LKKKIYIYILVVVVFLVGVYFLGTRITGAIAFILAALGLAKTKKDQVEKAKERINKAGDDVEAVKHDSDSALKFFDNFFSGDKK
jgi:ABC-type protease/lipase transport system fused ATPase/permease subunit